MEIKCPKCGFENHGDTLFCGKCGTRFPSPEEVEVTETMEAPKEELTRGTILANRYEIIEELGKGGMGKVYRVEDKKIKEEVALKLIKPEIASEKKTIERFSNELKMARKIAHRNVCRMYDLGEEKGTHYITMEYVPGEGLKRVAARGNVENVLLGSYLKAGDNLRINAYIKKIRTGEDMRIEAVEGKGEQSYFAMVDELTRRIKKNFQLSDEEISSDIDKEVGKITTSSPQAYRYYSQGRKYFFRGDFRQSIQLMDKAIALDPEFAMAYRSNGAAYYNLGNYTESRNSYQKASELIDRVSDREWYFLQIIKEKTPDKWIDVLNKLLELYPDDPIGNIKLGNIYGFSEEWDKAIERFEIARKYSPESIVAYWNLSWCYRAKGVYDKAREPLEYYLNNFSDNVWIRWQLAITYFCQGKYDLALSELDRALSLDPAHYYSLRLKGDIFLCEGNFVEAEKIYQKLLEGKNENAQFWGKDRLGCLYSLEGRFKQAKDQWQKGIDLDQVKSHFYLAYLYLKRGKPKPAMEEWKKGWSHIGDLDIYVYGFWQRNYLYLKGLVFIEMKSMDKAQKTADELKEIIEKGLNRKAMRYYYSLLGKIELERENLLKSIEYSEKASSLLSYQSGEEKDLDCHALFLAPLASAYYMSEDLGKAREEYEKITKLTLGRLHYGDIYAKSFYMLGKIYEQKGLQGKAIENYSKFLDLWKNADPDIAEVEDANRRLAGLKD